MHGLSNFEVMPGRPSSTFAEPDWLGIFIVFVIALIYSLMFYLLMEREENSQVEIKIQNSKIKMTMQKSILFLTWLFLILCFVLLLLTVSKSAWLGVAITTLVFLLAFVIKKQYNQFLCILLFIATGAIGSIGLIYFFNLTNFQLFNRILGAGTGMQKITISCDLEASLPKEIRSVNELEQYG